MVLFKFGSRRRMCTPTSSASRTFHDITHNIKFVIIQDIDFNIVIQIGPFRFNIQVTIAYLDSVQVICGIEIPQCNQSVSYIHSNIISSINIMQANFKHKAEYKSFGHIISKSNFKISEIDFDTIIYKMFRIDIKFISPSSLTSSWTRSS